MWFIDPDSRAVVASVPGIDIEQATGKGLDSLYLTVRDGNNELVQAIRIEGTEGLSCLVTLDPVDLVTAMLQLEDWARSSEGIASISALPGNLANAALKISQCYSHQVGKENDMGDDKIYKLIEAADRCRKEIVLCLMGKPGIGKTEAVERFAKDHGRNVVHIIASQILPTEVSGMTMPNQETHSMDVFDHYRLSHMKDGDILFFDELLKGQQQVLNACLTLIQERRLMSGTKLPDVLIVAAANPLASATQLPLEIRQRFVFVDVKWSPRSWISYMEGLGFKADETDWMSLAKRIEGDLKSELSPNWNELTPRTATKMMLWLRDSGSDDDVEKFVRNTFGAGTGQLMCDIASGAGSKPSSSDVMRDFIRNQAFELIPVDSYAKLEDIIDRKDGSLDTRDYRDIMDVLSKLDNWEEVREYLKDIDLKDFMQ